MITTKNNHYVPQFYLKKWSYDKNRIYVFNTLVSHKMVPLWSQKSVKNIAFMKDFYTREIDQKEIDDVEKWFKKDFEDPAKPAIDKIKDNSKLAASDWGILSKYIMSQYIRTPGRLVSLMKQWRIEMPKIFDEAINNLKIDIGNSHCREIIYTSHDETNFLPLKTTYSR